MGSSNKVLSDIVYSVYEIYNTVYGEGLRKVLLYGSYARGDYNDDSDIDLVAIVDGDRRKLQDQLKLVWRLINNLELKYEMIISPTVIPYNEFEQYKEELPYYRNIEKEGVEIVA